MKKMLLHVCCGPCAVYVAKKLSSSAKASEDKSQDYQVTLFFYNHNIYPKEEYKRRFNVLKHWTEKSNFLLIEGRYEHNKWLEAVKGLENEPEGGKRCSICFTVRLEESAKYAKEHGFEVLATTLTMGRNKKAEVINLLGVQIASKYGLKFIEADWKKQGGQEESHRLSKAEQMYRQNYCGCEFSIKD